MEKQEKKKKEEEKSAPLASFKSSQEPKKDVEQLFHIFHLSEEQKHCATEFLFNHSYNLVCQAKAGSGKTHLLICIAICVCVLNPEANVVLITYNKDLKQRTRELLKQTITTIDPSGKLRLKQRILAHNFHAAALFFFLAEWKKEINDFMCIEASTNNPKSPEIWKFLLNVTTVLVDEIQDTNSQYKELLLNIKRFSNPSSRFLLCGDYFQKINTFNGSQIAYMEEPARWFDTVMSGEGSFLEDSEEYKLFVQQQKLKLPKWKTCHLTISFRVPLNICLWINRFLNPNNLKFASGISLPYFNFKKDIWRNLWSEHGIRSPDTRKDVGCVFESIYDGSMERKEKIILRLVEVIQKFKSNEIVFLGHTFEKLKSYSPAAKFIDHLEHKLNLLGYHFERKKVLRYKIEEDGTENKNGELEDVSEKNLLPDKHILLRTVNTAKGNEWDLVICLDLFSNYFEERESTVDEKVLDLFNKLYVAATRAKCRLEIVHFSSDIHKTFATYRQTLNKQMKERKCQTNLRIPSMFMHVPFHPFLSSPDLLTRQVVFSTHKQFPILPSLHQIPGKQKVTVENVVNLYETALILALEIYLWIVAQNLERQKQKQEFRFLTSSSSSSSSPPSSPPTSTSTSSSFCGSTQKFQFSFPSLDKMELVAKESKESQTTWMSIVKFLRWCSEKGNEWTKLLFQQTTSQEKEKEKEKGKDERETIPVFSKCWEEKDTPQKINEGIWILLVKIANALQCIESGGSGRWRQIDNYEAWVPKNFLTHCFNNLMKQILEILRQQKKQEQQESGDLTSSPKKEEDDDAFASLLLLNQIKIRPSIQLGFLFPWTQLTSVSGNPDLVIGNTVVQIRLQNTAEQSTVLETQLYSAIQTLNNARKNKLAHPKTNGKYIHSFLLLPNMGITHRINWNPHAFSCFPKSAPEVVVPKIPEKEIKEKEKQVSGELEGEGEREGEEEEYDEMEMLQEELGISASDFMEVDDENSFSLETFYPTEKAIEVNAPLGDVFKILIDCIQRKSDTLGLQNSPVKLLVQSNQKTMHNYTAPKDSFVEKEKQLPKHLKRLLLQVPKGMTKENYLDLLLNFAIFFSSSSPSPSY